LNAHFLQPQGPVPPPGGGGIPSTPSTGTAPQGPGPGTGGGLGPLLPLLLFVPIIVMMLMQSRGQQKKRKELESKLKKGDRVVTQSGLVGKLAEWGDGRYAKLEVAPGVKLQILKSAVLELDAEPAAPGTKSEPGPEKK
jgi:preprotein translocase subunit YajC